ncbi:glyoxalase family protein [Sporothrix schenckii 1099-18]|uniref:Glyoxalase-like domain-containing protein n=2 Tax=Sporothrix schenckii TaxID=29908 RepID=U7PXQ1_SPOS1|nr:glyoxalase family protein [Sporothrix schenckii 1099-18]ERT00399.1 hypothetical protein HMPREF1624_03770 [Sporothrix schenckii ATCC 58251]KJR85120.1 glyoxalase family protein [Sporothrix schenckii 1099-18]
MAPKLDHIVLLVPHAVLSTLPTWLTGALTVVPGGQHAGGVTENQLVLFQDGVYVEIIAFVGDDAKKREAHRWGRQPEGHFVDWAVSLDKPTQKENDDAFTEIQQRVAAAGAGLGYHDLVDGGRTTPDGVVLRWATASPVALPGHGAVSGGLLPFWCIDRTDRTLRVPYATRPDLAQHPSQAVGVAGVTLHVADAAVVDRLRTAYDVLLTRRGDGTDDAWDVAAPETPSHGRTATLRIAVLDRTTAGPEIHSWIELALFTTGPAKTVGGHIVDGWRIDIRLESVA